MSKTSAFKFTNATDSTHLITPKLLSLTGNYAVETDTADDVMMNNKTAPIDAEEIIEFRSRALPKVNTNLNIQYPSTIKTGIQYQVSVEDTLTTLDSADAAFRVDEPIICQITFRHPKSGNITSTEVSTCFLRAISALMKADGTWRFDDLMRSAERPVVD